MSDSPAEDTRIQNGVARGRHETQLFAAAENVSEDRSFNGTAKVEQQETSLTQQA